MWATEWMLRGMLAHITRGNLQVTTAQGNTFSFGDGTAPVVAARFVTAAAQQAAVFDPGLKLGEAYMDGTFVIEHGSIADFVGLVAGTKAWPLWSAPIMALRFMLRRMEQFNLRRQARRNVAHHYDLDGRLYALFLDSDLQYSCAYLENPQDRLDDAQVAKTTASSPALEESFGPSNLLLVPRPRRLTNPTIAPPTAIAGRGKPSRDDARVLEMEPFVD